MPDFRRLARLYLSDKSLTRSPHIAPKSRSEALTFLSVLHELYKNEGDHIKSIQIGDIREEEMKYLEIRLTSVDKHSVPILCLPKTLKILKMRFKTTGK